MKASFFCVVTLALTLSLTMTGTVGAELLAWWPFDEGSGTTASDRTGNGNALTFVGDPEWTAGYLDGAIEFDGAGDYLESAIGSGLAVTGEVSMAAWIKLNVVGVDQKVGGNQNGSTGGFKMTVYSANKVEFEIRDSTNTSTLNRDVADGTTLEAGVWYHVAGVYSQSAGYIRTYVNGVPDRSLTTTAVLGASTGPMRIGCEPYTVTSNNFNGIIDDVRVYNHAVTETELPGIMAGGDLGLAKTPNPDDAATDVLRTAVVSWTAGKYAATHDVYFGTSFDDVNDASRTDPLGVLASQDQADAAYAPSERLDFSQTYYWRVDEVNAAPDNTIFKGEVWSFTTETYGLPIASLTVEASSEQPTSPAISTIDGSGLDELDQHGIDLKTMWITPGGLPAWIQYTFDKEYKLHELWIWNSNSELEAFMGFGAKDVTIEYSTDGSTWTPLENVPEFARGTAAATYTANTVVSFGGVAAKYVRLTVNTTWGATGMAGLSEVRFFYVPVQAREPRPADAETEVSVDTMLTWRAGREAASHSVCFGTDRQAVLDGTATVDVVTDVAYTPGELVFGNIYYWKVTEVNEAEPTAAWEGEVWTFTTEEFGAIDDFESYTDDIEAEETVWHAWIDGWGDKSNGSQVGYTDPPFCETTIVNGGLQSMPFQYNNAASPYYSEAVRTWGTAQDWTTNDADTFKLFFNGADAAVNSVAPFYIAVEDSTGKKLLLTHPDPNAVLATTWQAWTIPLSTFTDAGVNVTRIKKMYLGVGNRNSPTAGGAGTIFIDDIGRGTSLARHVRAAVTAPGDVVRGVPNDGIQDGSGNFGWPAAETPALAFDRKTTTKFLHFKGEIQPTGVQVTPSAGATIVTELTLTTANDAAERDPVTFELYGSNGSIDGPYTRIASGDIVDFAQATAWPRYTKNTTPITFDNSVAYKHYQVLFPTVRAPASANSMQIAEVELIGVIK
ncbi:MAG: LamG-like jellyroll fold domain-containing protein [Phycisphaerales bacterium]